MVNRLPREQRARILHLICEGSSLRSITRTTKVNINTVYRLLVDAGEVCQVYHDEVVRGLTPRYVEADELWCYVYAKAAHLPTALAAPPNAGDTWTWTAIDAETKLMITWYSGSRGLDAALPFFRDLKRRIAPGHRFQLTTDRHGPYGVAIPGVFGVEAVDYAQIRKRPREERLPAGGSRATVKQVDRKPRLGTPNPEKVSTSYVERQNLSIRMGLKRFTRSTNAASKKLDRHRHALSLYFTYHNFCREHLSLSTTPAVASGLATAPQPVEWLVQLVDDYFPARGRRRVRPPY